MCAVSVGRVDSATVVKSIHDAYEEIVHWRCNSFLVPSSMIAKEFVLELTRLYQAYADNTTYFMYIVLILLLQRVSFYR